MNLLQDLTSGAAGGGQSTPFAYPGYESLIGANIPHDVYTTLPPVSLL